MLYCYDKCQTKRVTLDSLYYGAHECNVTTKTTFHH